TTRRSQPRPMILKRRPTPDPYYLQRNFMPESVRTYLTAGLSTAAAGAIIAAPVSSLSSPQAASPQPQVRNSDVRLEAVSTQLTLSGPAHRTEAVHLLAEV